MTELTEQQQRLVYEWLRPELKGKPWKIDSYGCDSCSMTYQFAYWPISANHTLSLPLLDYNTFMEEATPKLTTEDVNVSYNLMGTPEWYLDHMSSPHAVYINADQWLAVVKYLEEK